MPGPREDRSILEGRGTGTDRVVSPDGRESDDHLAAAVEAITSSLDRAAVQFDDGLDQRQADTESSTPPHQGRVGLRERIEDVRQKIRGNPVPRVANRQDEVPPSVPTESSIRPSCGVNLTALVRRLQMTCSSRAGSASSCGRSGAAATCR